MGFMNMKIFFKKNLEKKTTNLLKGRRKVDALTFIRLLLVLFLVEEVSQIGSLSIVVEFYFSPSTM